MTQTSAVGVDPVHGLDTVHVIDDASKRDPCTVRGECGFHVESIPGHLPLFRTVAVHDPNRRAEERLGRVECVESDLPAVGRPGRRLLDPWSGCQRSPTAAVGTDASQMYVSNVVGEIECDAATARGPVREARWVGGEATLVLSVRI